MTQDEIIKMAHQTSKEWLKEFPTPEETAHPVPKRFLEIFAKLVAEKELKKASERVWIALTNKGAVWHLKQMCTDAIEARGEECTK